MYYPSLTSHELFIAQGSAVFYCALSLFNPLKRSLLRGGHSLVSSLFALIIILTVFLKSPFVWASSPFVADDYHRMAYDAQQNGDYSKALSYYFKALTVDSKNASYWNDIGLVYESMGDLENAQRSYLRAISMDANYLAPYGNLGLVYQKQQNPVKAVYYLKKRIELGDPADPWTQKARDELDDIYMATPLYRERFLKAETKRLNLEASQKSRDNFQNQIKVANSEYERGMALLKEENSQDAVKAFNASLAFAPGNPKVVKARAQAQKLYRSQQVEKTVQQAMVYLKEGKEQAAKKKFNEVLAIIPNQPN